MSSTNGTAAIVRRHLVSEFIAFAGDNWERAFHNPKATAEAWVEELADIPVKLLAEALKRARRSKYLPNIGDVREIAESLAESRTVCPVTDTRRLLDRGPKPADWEPLAPEERAALFEKFRARVDVVAHDKTMPAARESDPEARLRKLRQQAAELQKKQGGAV